MRVLLVLLLAAGLGILPFVMLRQPWALKIWQRVRLILVVYALVIVVAGIARLFYGCDEIYGWGVCP